ncbi:MAG: hypothetical protein Q8K05_16250 [Polaromonas sp.]|uniref:hypothetical protein n=1 Tax=Polaromonas sp. TaxID=1869339 RepID=UPI00273088AD|nr:hypothetical protein [Polaromonas sp.]MDP2257575.1 hypothetical protein [Polaromonas sp.]
MKFAIAIVFALFWTAISIYLAQYWFGELSALIGVFLTAAIILGIAIIPGFMNAFLLAGLIMDRRPKCVPLAIYPISLYTTFFLF